MTVGHDPALAEFSPPTFPFARQVGQEHDAGLVGDHVAVGWATKIGNAYLFWVADMDGRTAGTGLEEARGCQRQAPPRGPGHFCAQMPQEMGQADLVERVSIDVAVRPRRNARATHATHKVDADMRRLCGERRLGRGVQANAGYADLAAAPHRGRRYRTGGLRQRAVSWC